jgi:hypothetical protein
VTVSYAPTNPFGNSQQRQLYPDFSADGTRLLLAYASDAAGTARAYVYDFDEDRLLAVTPPGVTGPLVLSPDGRHVASNDPGGLAVYAVDTGDVHEVPGGPDPGRLVRWSNEDEYVYLIELQTAGGKLFRRSVITGEREYVRVIRAADPAGVTRFEPWVSRDGQAQAYTLDRVRTNLFVHEGLR